MKKILSLMLALLAIATTARAQTDYGIWVGGVKVTSDNASNITGGDIKQGTITYDAEKKFLTLRNVIITRSGSGRNAIHNEKCEGLRITFYGANNLTTNGASTIKIEKKSIIGIPLNANLNLFQQGSGDEGIYIVSSDLTIEGKGNLYISSYDTGIEGKNATESLTIEDTNVEIKSTNDCLLDFANVSFKGFSTAKLVPMNTSTSVKRVGNVKKMTFEIDQLIALQGATFDSSQKTITLGGVPITNRNIVIRNYIDIDATNFPDANFRKWLLAQEYGKDKMLTGEEIDGVRKIDVSTQSIANLQGIELFKELSELDCKDNKLTALDISKNTDLQVLSCNNNQLTALDVSKNVYLVILNCGNNRLTSLDVKRHMQLQNLFCSDNQLTSIDVTQNSLLLILSCGNNQLTKLDVTHNGLLTTLYCEDNKLTSLDVKKNTNLKGLYCANNQLTLLTVYENTNLSVVRCYGNKIGKENMQSLVNSLPNKVGGSGSLHVIDKTNSNEENFITPNQVTAAKNKNWNVWAKGKDGTDEYAGSVVITAYCIEGGTVEGEGTYEKGTTATLTAKPKEGYKFVRWADNSVTVCTVATFTFKAESDKHYQAIFEKDVPTGIAINETNFPDKNFRTFVSGTTIDKNKDGYLSNEEIAAVSTMNVTNREIGSLTGIEHFTALTELSCGLNQLTSLDVSKNTALTTLWCNNNQLTALDVSKNTKLKKLRCYSNQIKGDKMLALVNSLPTVSGGKGEFHVINTKDTNEQNVITKSQVEIAKGKNWTVYDSNGSSWVEYAGSEDPATEPKILAVTFTKAVTPVSELDAQGRLALSAVTTLAEKEKLNGYSLVVDPRKGAILKRGTKTLFELATTNGTITVSKGVTSDDNINVELDRDLIRVLSQALGTTEGQMLSGFDAIQVKFDIDTTTAIDAPLNDNVEMTNDSWYTIDGKKLQGEPTKKGVYIIKGKKVKR